MSEERRLGKKKGKWKSVSYPEVRLANDGQEVEIKMRGSPCVWLSLCTQNTGSFIQHIEPSTYYCRAALSACSIAKYNTDESVFTWGLQAVVQTDRN